MFKNIGGKIKVLAKVFCWLGIITSIIVGTAIIFGGREVMSSLPGGYSYYYYDSTATTIIGVAVIVLGSLFSWLGSFFTYGFGQLVENSDRIADRMR